MHLKLTCDHISSNSVYCNRYNIISISLDETAQEAIELSEWTVRDGDVLCEDHRGDN